jgi:hypothetical protein
VVVLVGMVAWYHEYDAEQVAVPLDAALDLPKSN